jgi:hypothetical protein
MKSVFKYPFEIQDNFEIEMPVDAQILHVGAQPSVGSHFNARACIWALVDLDLNIPKQIRKFRLAGTGHPIEEALSKSEFIGTIMLLEGQLVFHLFDVTEVE